MWPDTPVRTGPRSWSGSAPASCSCPSPTTGAAVPTPAAVPACGAAAARRVRGRDAARRQSHRRPDLDPGGPAVRVVIAEDSILLRDGLSRLFASRGVDVAAAVGDATALLAAVDRYRPELIVADVRMPPGFTDQGLRAGLGIS